MFYFNFIYLFIFYVHSIFGLQYYFKCLVTCVFTAQHCKPQLSNKPIKQQYIWVRHCAPDKISHYSEVSTHYEK